METGLTKYCILHKRHDAPNSTWGSFIWAEDYMKAWKKAEYLEKNIPLVYDITIEGIFLYEVETDIDTGQFELLGDGLDTVEPWFIYYQLGEYIQYEDSDKIYDKLIQYFERHEEYEKCAELVQIKQNAYKS